jgi:hypothetical protein
MVEKAKLFYFGVFILVVFAFIFHVTAMGHHHWKKANIRDPAAGANYGFNYTNIGLFKRCLSIDGYQVETCFLNMYPMNDACTILTVCQESNPDSSCSCDYLPSTKGIAACTIIAAIFLGLAIIILFTHSVNTAENRSVGLLLGLLPLFLLLLAFIFILIALILVGSYLSREIMTLTRNYPTLSMYILKAKKKKL